MSKPIESKKDDIIKTTEHQVDKVKSQLSQDSGLYKTYAFTLISTAGLFYGFKHYNIHYQNSHLIPSLVGLPLFYYLGKKIFYQNDVYNRYNETKNRASRV
jgi:hypothetical protein